MARYIPDGKLRVAFVPTIADTSAPTATEVTAGTDLTELLVELTTPLTGSVVDVPDPTSRYNKTAAGTFGGQPIDGTWYRDEVAANDVAWATLPTGTEGYLVVRRSDAQGTAGPIASGDVVEVWPIEVVTREPAPYRRNEPDKFRTEAAVPDAPSFDATVAV